VLQAPEGRDSDNWDSRGGGVPEQRQPDDPHQLDEPHVAVLPPGAQIHVDPLAKSRLI
jgi:hypothetical protein